MPKASPTAPEFPDADAFQPASPIIARTYTPQQLQPPRKVTKYEERARARARGEVPRRGCRFISCRTLGCLFLLLLCGLGVFTVYVVLAKPPVVINPIKQWLNADTVAQDPLTTDPVAVLAGLNSKVKDFEVGENKFVLTENELRTLISERLKPVVGQEVFLDVLSDKLRIYWNVESSTDIPLWLAVDFSVRDGTKVVLERVGTVRIPAPGFVNQLLTRLITSALDRQEGDATDQQSLLGLVMPFPENVTVTKVELGNDEVVITLDVKTGLDGLFE